MTELWKGLHKLTEEAGEVLQVLGKLGAYPRCNHPTTDLKAKLVEELADLDAALTYFLKTNFTSAEVHAINTRAFEKGCKFDQWGLSGILTKDTVSASYVGTEFRHQGHRALLQFTAEPTVVKVQFNSHNHPFSTGWHAFPASDWKVEA